MEGETAEGAVEVAFNLGPQFERARDEASVIREAVEGAQLQVTLVQGDLERFKGIVRAIDARLSTALHAVDAMK